MYFAGKKASPRRTLLPTRASETLTLSVLPLLTRLPALRHSASRTTVQRLVNRQLVLVGSKDQGGRLRFRIQREVLTKGVVEADGHAVDGREIIAATLGGFRTGRLFQKKTEKFPPAVGLLTSGMTLCRALQFQIEWVRLLWNDG
jgi:hypothetical protein